MTTQTIAVTRASTSVLHFLIVIVIVENQGGGDGPHGRMFIFRYEFFSSCNLGRYPAGVPPGRPRAWRFITHSENVCFILPSAVERQR